MPGSLLSAGRRCRPWRRKSARPAHDAPAVRSRAGGDGITVDRIVVDTGGLPAACPAPPESCHPAVDPDPRTGPGPDAPDR
ncbi:hypothetical protein ACH47C_19865 [Streptomyces rishiriensis]|uniref:hypothetical protein n=1 Tax=Streptomyces rishiriensis TaxID=68264 RepID=UPI00131ED80F|nr:hypothetical protein [Streptomyces rishiriensis]